MGEIAGVFLATTNLFLYLHPQSTIDCLEGQSSTRCLGVDAQMAKLVDAPSSGGGAVRCAGSNPVLGTSAPDYRRGFLHFRSEASLLAEADKGNNPAPRGAGGDWVRPL
jgi:hypothetical protein